MFKDTYKAANDDIKADDVLLGKVLRQKKRKRTPVYKYSSIAAAVVVISAAVVSIPLMNKDNTGVIYEDISVSTAAPAQVKSAVSGTSEREKTAPTAKPQPVPTQKVQAERETENTKNVQTAAPQRESDSTRTVSPSPQRTGGTSQVTTEQSQSTKSSASTKTDEQSVSSEPKAYTDELQQNNSVNTETSDAENISGVSDYAVEPDMDTVIEYKMQQWLSASASVDDVPKTDETVENISKEPTDETSSKEELPNKQVNTFTKSVVLNMNSEDYGSSYNVMSGNINDCADSGLYTTAEWSMEDYFNYIGTNVFEKISLESDFEYIGDYEMSVSVNESGEPGFDNRIFPYEGSGGRYVTVITSKNTMTAQAYITDERYVKSDINGTSAVIIGSDMDYKCYIISGGISYIITAKGIEEGELENLLVSIGG